MPSCCFRISRRCPHRLGKETGMDRGRSQHGSALALDRSRPGSYLRFAYLDILPEAQYGPLECLLEDNTHIELVAPDSVAGGIGGTNREAP